MTASTSSTEGGYPATTKWGERLLPVVIDEAARDTPSRAWASVPVDDADLSKGFEDITYEAFANAINKLAWFIQSSMGGQPSVSFETLAYLGAFDVRYSMMQVAACKTGHKVLFSSHLNSSPMHRSLMRDTGCLALFSARGVHVADLLAAPGSEDDPLPHFVVPDLDDLLDLSDRAEHYPYSKTFEEAQWDPYLVLHSSGTTGSPKPVTFNHAVIAALDRQHLLPDVEGRGHMIDHMSGPGMGSRYLMVTAPFHAMVSVFMMSMSVFGGVGRCL
jgi:acyl-CoA synthetase (AMP-forming)/AMP-acid ligase II